MHMCAAFLGKFWKPVGLGCLRGEIRCQQKLFGAGGAQGRVEALRMEEEVWRGGVCSLQEAERSSLLPPAPPLGSQCRRPGTHPAANEPAQDTGLLPTGHSRGHLVWSLPHNHDPVPPSPAAPRLSADIPVHFTTRLNPRTAPSITACQALRPMRKYTTEGTDTIQLRALTRSRAHRPQSRVQHPSEGTRAARNITRVEAWVRSLTGTTTAPPCSLPQGAQGILPTPYQVQKKCRQKFFCETLYLVFFRQEST